VLYNLDVDKGLFWLFNIEEGTCFKLNKVSYFILSCFDGRRDISSIQEQVLLKYPNESPEIVLNDFKELFNTLKEKGIIKLVS
jgi:methyltransferase-like protein